MKRTKHSLSNYKLLSCNMGNLVPIGVSPVLPGDTFQHSTSALIRVSPLVAPVMHPVQVRIHHWYVPYRILDTETFSWEKFITGGPDGKDEQIPPTLLVDPSMKKSLHDYFGCGIPEASNYSVNAFYVYAYNKIFNEFYRDQHLQTERAMDNTTLASCAWEKDYFTSARPFTQLGDEVTLPIATNATFTGDVVVDTDQPFPRFVVDGDTQSKVLNVNNVNSQVTIGPDLPLAAGPLSWSPDTTGLVANGLVDLESAEQISINDFRKGFALQRYREARARYGSRYTEYLAYLGVKSSDARLQRPEYLGGGKQTISFSEVLQTVDDETGQERGPLGKMGGHGIAAIRSNRYRKFFEEHGCVISLMSIRPKTVYNNGVPRELLKRDKEDWYQRELEHIGQQEVWNGEVFGNNETTNYQTFGYNDRYAEYRRQWSTTAGDFRDLLNYWHMARDFNSTPVLNNSFIECDPTDRIHADQTETDKIWVMANHNIKTRRLVRKPAINRVI